MSTMFNHRYNGGMTLTDKSKATVLTISILSAVVMISVIVLTVVIALTIYSERDKRHTYSSPSMITFPTMPYGQTMEGSSIFNKRDSYAAVRKPLGRPNLNRRLIKDLKNAMIEKVDNNKFYSASELLDVLGVDDYNKLVNNQLLVTSTGTYSPVDINNCFDLLNQIYSDMVMNGSDVVSDVSISKIVSSPLFKEPQAESYTKDEVIASIGKETLDELIDLNYLIDAESYPKTELVGIYKKITGEPDKMTYIPYLMQNRIKTKNIERD